MKIDILTLFPEMFDGFINTSIIKRAIEKGLLEVNLINFRDYSPLNNKQVDDTPYGGGAGMLMQAQPVYDAWRSIVDKIGTKPRTIYLTPQGPTFTQQAAKSFAKEENLIFLCGHYEGFDERIKTRVDEVISIGDYILTGGEIPSMAITDSIARLIPGVITSKSLEDESFNSSFLDYPTYTKPSVYRGLEVPKVLLSGNHKNIEEYRNISRIEKTKILRPDLMEEDHE